MFKLPSKVNLASFKGKGHLAKFPLRSRSISNSSLPLSYMTPKEVSNVSASPPRPKRIVVAITGATGVALGIKLLQILKELSVETHLIISKWGAATMKYETDWEPHDVAALASKTYSVRDVSACISSGSFQHDGMIVAPCSMKTLAAIRIGFTEDLITRAADVSIKENRKLLLVTRETPLSAIHLENMLFLRRTGVIIFPPVPAYYTKPKSMNDLLEQSAGRILDCFGIHADTFPRWEGIKIK
ncbi:hypothetical protein SKDZ_04G7220 [Saccharomyces kudriavzevii ZP591]|uniref:Flavin prenyltransferase PAD1, mitochondrial n=1 Tax=Saccharomyces cerevisiae x Saccharomyces kudriavzevii (strain VIN7) TaxID=1095631 RepID=H0GTK2_SACCK|nr:Pad1p [Saccharomyces cerevisiae x Saccharomyces kudriavzevii VIN7]CAI4059588.1 hypothetical protein SKDZ_04G7220 [Saccharomyces kudriavzevii ZP591]